MGICTVSGNLRDITGAAVANTALWLESGGIGARDGSVVIPTRASAISDGSGNFTIDLFPGLYAMKVLADGKTHSSLVSVPDRASAVLADLFGGTPELTNSLVARALAARDAAVAAAKQAQAAADHILESGSNANGEYMRFLGGRQICTRTANLGSVIANGAGNWASPYYTNPMTLTYAAAFAAPPALSFSFPTIGGLAVPDRILQPAGFDVGTASITNLRVARIGGGNADANVTCIMTAIGRWL